jgi:glutaredoxin
MKSGFVPLVAALLLAASPVSAQYRWVDADGRVNYGDQPPSDAQQLTRIDPRGVARNDPVAALPFELRRAMSQHPVTLYTADNCPGCEGARAYLRRRGVPFQEIVVETVDEAAELKRRVGVDSVPVLSLGRTPTIGFNEAVWSKALDAATYPPQSVLPVTYRVAPPQPLLPRVAGPVSEAAPEKNSR